MIPKASPYSGSYVIYAYEFTDRHAYVGLTFLPKERHAQHQQRGPVFEHIQTCPEYSYKIVERAINTPQAASAREAHWLATYKEAGWTLLNTFKAGGLGTVQATKWTKESVIAEAQKYQSKQAWIDGSQFTYRLAKREGWFAEASAHMPARVLGVGVGSKRSAETRAKLKEVAERRSSDPKWRADHSAALKGRKLTQDHKLAISRGMAKTPGA